MLTDAARFDEIVAGNLFGDILTDLAGTVRVGVDLAASANVNPSGSFPSMFEPVHGSAPDVVGLAKANPMAAILPSAPTLEYLGFTETANLIARAVEHCPPKYGSQHQPLTNLDMRNAIWSFLA
jgi:3-isopropylmalate dehydrogenase